MNQNPISVIDSIGKAGFTYCIELRKIVEKIFYVLCHLRGLIYPCKGFVFFLLHYLFSSLLSGFVLFLLTITASTFVLKVESCGYGRDLYKDSQHLSKYVFRNTCIIAINTKLYFIFFFINEILQNGWQYSLS